MPEERISWKESNLAGIGSDLDHKIKAAAAEAEDAWSTVGKAPGVKVWRIENFQVKTWPEADYGCFYTGDSYIVLNSYKEGDSDKLHHDLFVWIGKESSQDEYGTAAYKMVEADEYVGGIAVQHREVQNHESSGFQQLFTGDLTYWTGGVDSGFNHVEPTPETPNMFKVKGKRSNMALTQISVSKSSLNEGDSFILKASSEKIWVWHGKDANFGEKSRANALGEKMCTEGTVVVLDHGQGDEEDAEFWGYLGDGEIAPADNEDHAVEEFAPLLFRLGDGEPEQVGKGEPTKVGIVTSSKLDRSLLNESDVFLLDAGWEVFTWIGKDADRSEKLSSFSKADKYCQGDPRTCDLPLTIVKSGYESNDFNSFFA